MGFCTAGRMTFFHRNTVTSLGMHLVCHFPYYPYLCTFLHHHPYLLLLFFILVILSSVGTQFESQGYLMLGSNPVAVLATLFLLSYAKLLRTIIVVFYYADVHVEYPNRLISKIWFYDGNVLYLQGKHIPLFIFALGFFLLIFVPYNFVLIFSPYLQRLSGKVKQSKVKLPFHNMFAQLAGWYEDYRIQWRIQDFI